MCPVVFPFASRPVACFFNFFLIKSNVCYLQLYLSKRGAVCRLSSVTGVCEIEKALSIERAVVFFERCVYLFPVY